ncbi:MAG TPA: shikimate dehydrogenase [Streptosporangiaceae bacterium]|jgi:shikimate dehydrogenase
MKAAVLGAPIAHSLSPVLHRAAYQAVGLTGWSYQAIECDEAGLPGLIAGCGPDWAGLSLTMPLKRAVLSLLDEAEPLVGEVGAANTVRFDAGLRHGHNTDVPGISDALLSRGDDPPEPPDRRSAPSGGEPPRQWGDGPPEPPDRRSAPRPLPRPGYGLGLTRESLRTLIEEGEPGVLILGGGATACSALAAVRGLGASQATAAVRDPRRAGDLLAAADRLGLPVRLAPFDEPAQPAPGLLISTAPAGAADRYAERIRQGTLAPGCVLDVVYHPWPTALATAAQQAGVPTAGGFALLLHQAARQVELMTGKSAPVEAMRAAGLAALAARR